VYAAVATLLVNLLICVTLTPIFKSLGIAAGEDETTPADFEARPVPGLLQRSHVQSASPRTQQIVGTSARNDYSVRQ
jgi:hypothetical protein